MVELTDRYVITSNRESGFDRYDVMLEPRRIPGIVLGEGGKGTITNYAIIIEFKVQDEEEKELADTVSAALRQFEEKDYQASLTTKGFPQERIRKYGFAFCGKKCWTVRRYKTSQGSCQSICPGGCS